MPIVAIVGLKHSGKSTVGRIVAKALGWKWLDTDELIVAQHGARSVRELFASVGAAKFGSFEAETIAWITATHHNAIVSTGGGVVENEEAWSRLRAATAVVFLDEKMDVLVSRIFRDGIPAFLDQKDPQQDFERIATRRRASYAAGAQFVLAVNGRTPAQLSEELIGWIKEVTAYGR